MNSRVKLTERVVLPRLRDARDCILELMQRYGREWELMGLDFSGAFTQLFVAPRERKYLTGAALNGYFVYSTIMFGILSGPLVWGRNAAMLMRITSVMVMYKPVRTECFVDDLLVAVAGSKAERTKYLLYVILLWLALGYKLAWKKGTRGQEVPWIGATIAP